MITLKERYYVDEIPKGITAILGADIGGTNSNFGIFKNTDKPQLLFSLHAKSQQITNFPALVKQVLDSIKNKHNITIKHALFAAAGVVSAQKDYAKPTNLPIEIDAKKIRQQTGLSCVYIVNDFEVIGYGLGLIDPKELIVVNKGKPREHANKAIIGAGTGLGKCIMHWSRCSNRYIPVPSEGGHADFAIQHPIELELAEFIKKSEKFICNVSWEDVLSGNGVQRIYQFFHNQKNGHHAKKEQVPHCDEIFKSRNHDHHSIDTLNLYTKIYARCVKDFALDALALGGIYIAGGIATHNIELFKQPTFWDEFINCGKQQMLLKDVPIYVIGDYNVSLYGAAEYLKLENMCE